MAIISKPTGLDTTGRLLYEILRQLDSLSKIISVITISSGTGTGVVNGYLIIPDADTGLDFRIGVRNNQYVIDKELTATGFAGTEDLDWENIGGAV